MARTTDLKEFKKQHRSLYSRIYAEGYHDAYRQLKSNGEVQLYRIQYVSADESGSGHKSKR